MNLVSLRPRTRVGEVVILSADRVHRSRLPLQRSGILGCNDRQTYTSDRKPCFGGDRIQVQGSGLLFDLPVSHTLSPRGSPHRVLLLQSPLIYVHIWTLDWRSDLFVPVPSARGVTKVWVG